MKYSKEIFYQEFIRREDSTNRAPYNPELEFYSIIQNGDIYEDFKRKLINWKKNS